MTWLIRLSLLINLVSLILFNIARAEEAPLPLDDSQVEEAEIAIEGAELFGLSINNLSQETLEDKLAEMGVDRFASAKDFKVMYNLGERDVLGIHKILVEYNDYYFVTQITLYGRIENNMQRKRLGNLLVQRYKEPMAGKINEGYGRAQWRFSDGTMIDLNNSTFDVKVVYRDLIPSRNLVAGEIDVQALKDSL
ncbi:uridine kinase [Marinomonas agarivorans]|nr:uridine kinase [Marinomonas agarivorans]